MRDIMREVQVDTTGTCVFVVRERIRSFKTTT
jgi:hypothetical protein